MRVFSKWPAQRGEHGVICPVCLTGVEGECVLIPIPGTQEGLNIEAECVHLECLSLAIAELKEIRAEVNRIYDKLSQ